MNHVGSRRFLMLLVSLIPLYVAAPLPAEKNVNPGFNSYYENADVEQWQGVFEREGREVWDKREEIVLRLGLKPGMAAADVGAGTGFFTLLIAHEVGSDGRVYAVDIEKNFVDASVERVRKAGLDNAVGIINDQKSVKLPRESVDMVFISDTYHHFEYPKTTLQSIHEALRPEGELVIIDYKRVAGESSAWVMSHIRVDTGGVIDEVESQGFRLVERPDFMRSRFFLRFQKQPGDQIKP